MAAIHHDLREIHSVGTDTREQVVTRAACPMLADHGIFLAGTSSARLGFRFVRLDPQVAQVLVCVAGRGRVLVDGQWRPCEAGQAYVTPAGVKHAYEAERLGHWDVCWVIFSPPEQSPVAHVAAPTLVATDPEPMCAAVTQLYREAVGAADASLMRQWVALVHTCAARIAQRSGEGQRLWRLWQAVDADLARPWTLRDMAKIARVSEEHLRRLCIAYVGRPPMRQVAHLRMHRAAALLSATPWSVEAIARSVGYDNAFAFSTAFKRVLGATPTAYRRQSTGTR